MDEDLRVEYNTGVGIALKLGMVLELVGLVKRDMCVATISEWNEVYEGSLKR